MYKCDNDAHMSALFTVIIDGLGRRRIRVSLTVLRNEHTVTRAPCGFTRAQSRNELMCVCVGLPLITATGFNTRRADS